MPKRPLSVRVGEVFESQNTRIKFLEEELKGRDHEIEFLNKCRKALESLTPGGSEYFRDPERCVSCVRDRFKTGHEAKKELVKLRKSLR